MEKMIVQYDTKNIFIVVLVAILVVLFVIIVNLMYTLSLVQNLLMSWIITTLYSLFAFFIIDNTVIRQIESEKIIERPVEVIREVFVPYENKVTEIVEMPVIKEVPVYMKEQIIRKKLNTPKYDYIASSETKKYHTRNCRFGKLIKKKYKIYNNETAFFKKMDFKACKICIK